MAQITDTMILKAVLMLRRLGNTYNTKEEQIAQERQWIAEGFYPRDTFAEWIAAMREELAKTPEEREAESARACEEMAEREAEEEYHERMAARYERDEWADYWDDAARSVGAIRW